MSSRSEAIADLLIPLLRRAAAAACQPDIDLELFAQRVLAIAYRHEGSDASPRRIVRLVKGLHLEDLSLTEACARGESRAWVTIRERYEAHVRHIARSCAGVLAGRELAETVWGELFLARGAGPSRIATYDGRGTLAGWLRAVVATMAIDQRRRRRPEEPLEESTQPRAAEPVHQVDGVEFAIEQRLRSLFAVSLRTVLGSLEPREKLLLDSYYYRQLTLEEIGILLGAHKATISRRLTALRRKVMRATMRAVRKRARVYVDARALQHLARGAGEHLQLDLRRCLAEHDAGERP